jgi:hypothetical protein
LKGKILGILILTLFITSNIAIATTMQNSPPNVPSEPHPEDGAIDIGVKTHLSWKGGDPDPGDKAVYDLYFGNLTNPGMIASDLTKPNYYPGVLEHNISYYWYVVAKDENGTSTTGPEWTFTTNNCTCDPPEKPSGPARVRNRTRYEYTTKIKNMSQNGWYYNFSWGDGNHSQWLGPFNHTERVRAEHQWEEQGTYQVQARARFKNGNRSDEWIITGWSDILIVTVTSDNPQNDPPNAPVIDGQTQGKPDVEFEYTFIATDPDEDDLYYNVCWEGCGSETYTYGPYQSGEEVILSYSWPEQGTYIICSKAVDVYGEEGPEGTLEVTMPFNKNVDKNQFWQRLRNRICDMLGICRGGCNLTEITGTLEYDGQNFIIDTMELHFGPNWYINSAVASYDYDEDGEEEIIFEELQGLVGTEVKIEGHVQSDNWISVFTINGLVYREPGQPIWASQHQWRWGNGHGQE